MDIQLEKRTCVSCARPFKVMPTSPSKACSKMCMSDAGIEVKVVKEKPMRDFSKTEQFGKLRVVEQLEKAAKTPGIEPSTWTTHPSPTKPKPSVPVRELHTPSGTKEAVPAVIVPVREHLLEVSALAPLEVKTESDGIQTPEPSDIKELTPKKSLEVNALKEKRWQEYVTRAKSAVSRMAHDRLEIATLALEVCDIHWGGGDHWRNFSGVYTLSRFASEIGVNSKTLSNWVRVKRNVYDKIKPLILISPIQDWTAMVRVSDRCKHDETPAQVLKKFQSWDSGSEKDFNQKRYTLMASRRLKSYLYFLENHAAPKKMGIDEMIDMADHCKRILKWIKTHEGEFK